VFKLGGGSAIESLEVSHPMGFNVFCFLFLLGPHVFIIIIIIIIVFQAY